MIFENYFFVHKIVQVYYKKTIFFSDVPTLNGPLVHKTFLDEIVFWTVKFEFPQELVCLLLNMRPDPDYEVSFFLCKIQFVNVLHL